MSMDFEELDYRNTPLGEISLRRRTEPRLGIEVYEVKLDDEFLMSSLFVDGEIELARLALPARWMWRLAAWDWAIRHVRRWIMPRCVRCW